MRVCSFDLYRQRWEESLIQDGQLSVDFRPTRVVSTACYIYKYVLMLVVTKDKNKARKTTASQIDIDTHPGYKV